MGNNNLRVLRGGLLDTSLTSRKEFVSAYITDTRLMGVVGMYIHWMLPENQRVKDFHQFFYFDAEEYGFDTYKSVMGNDAQEIDKIENSLIGGLGGQKIPINHSEAIYTLHYYAKMNYRDNLEFPEHEEEYKFLLEAQANLSEPDRYILMHKQCVTLSNSFEVINYFLMRSFGKDIDGAAYLTTNGRSSDLFPLFKAATFYKNNIKFTETEHLFNCESLIEFDDTYYIVLTNILLDGMYVKECKLISSMKLSSQEAAMQLSRSEFVSVMEISDTSLIGRYMSNLSKTAMITSHENGTLYMIFNSNNAHVSRQNYRLNEDVLGMYYVSNDNQFIAVAYSYKDIQILEKDLEISLLATFLSPISKYEFIEPVFYEFMKSGFPDFETFVDAIQLTEK